MLAIEVNETALEHDKNVQRVAALVTAIAEIASTVPGEDPILIHVQSLASTAVEYAERLVSSKDALIALLYVPIPA